MRPLLMRPYRGDGPRASSARIAKGGVKPATVRSFRETVAFLRDAGIYTGSAGLRHGDFYRVRVPGYSIHVVTDPGLIEQILVTDADHFEKSRIYWRELRRVVGDAMGSLEGARWDYLRQLQQPFFTPRAAQRYMPAAFEVTTSYLDRLEERLGESPGVPILRLLSELNIRILLTTLFDGSAATPPAGLWDRISDGEHVIAWRSKYPWRPLTGWLTGANQRTLRHKAFFSAYADRLRDEATASPGSTEAASLLEALLRVHADPTAPHFPNTLLRNEIIVHLGAGTETQGTAEGWILYLLWKHQELLERMRSEIEMVTGGDRLGLRHLSEMTYTRQVVREGLRLYPPSYALVRDCVRATTLNGQEIREGEVLFISLYALHRNPRLWEDPDRFDPDRFAAGAPPIGRYQYLPFGAGQHVCIGQHLALPSMILALGQFAQRFDWSFTESDIRPIGLSTLKPNGDFVATLTPRR